MDSASSESPATKPEFKDKGLKRNAISFVSNIVIGVASAAPAYSLATSLGLVAAAVGVAAPAIMIVAFVPMLCIAAAYYSLNRVDPDCGTTFSWVTRALGPHAGWMGGWGLIVTGIIVMPTLADISGHYSFKLIGIEATRPWAVSAGVVWIAVMTGICYVGIEVSARTQRFLLGAELITLLIFAVVALARVYGGSAGPDAHRVSLDWLNPFAIGNLDNFTQAVLAAVFIYWGWDAGVSVNEETVDAETAPGRAAIVSNLVLVGTYVVAAVAAVAFSGPDQLAKSSDDVFAGIGEDVLGFWLDKLLIIAVLTSAAASTQTTILPTARTALSMARVGAMPARFGEVHPRYRTPSFSTLVMGGVSIAWYVALAAVSSNESDVLSQSVVGLGLGISFYYGMSGLACVVLFRRALFRSAKNFLLMGALPAFGTLSMFALFIKSCLDPKNAGIPIAIGLGGVLIGLLPMVLAQLALPGFFRRKAN